MKKVVLLKSLTLLFFLSHGVTVAQDCKATTFVQLKSVQESRAEDKEDAVLKLGYSFEREEERGGYTLRYYGKCLQPNLGYIQRITLNITQGSTSLATYTRSTYVTIKEYVRANLRCRRRQQSGFDVFENCSDRHAYLFQVNQVEGKGYYYIEIQN